MLKDHEIKDKILESLIAQKGEAYCSSESISNFYNISKERAEKLLEKIYDDSYCSKRKGYGRNEYKYNANEDTEPFLKKKGYTGLARKEYWRNFPKDKWYFLDPVKFIAGAIVGSLLTWLTLRQVEPKKDSLNNIQKEQKSIDTVGKDTTGVHPIDTSKR